MSSVIAYPFGVDYRTPRPRGENTLGGLIIGAIIGGIFTRNPAGALAGGTVGSIVSSGPPPLETAIRSYFEKQQLTIVGFYRYGPRAAKVLFRYKNQYWTIDSRAPENSTWTSDLLEDWLYGDLVDRQLPNKLRDIDAHLRR